MLQELRQFSGACRNAHVLRRDGATADALLLLRPAFVLIVSGVTQQFLPALVDFHEDTEVLLQIVDLLTAFGGRIDRRATVAFLELRMGRKVAASAKRIL